MLCSSRGRQPRSMPRGFAMSSTFFIPAVNIMGIDCLDEAMDAIRNQGFRKALIVTDNGLAKAGVAAQGGQM